MRLTVVNVIKSLGARAPEAAAFIRVSIPPPATSSERHSVMLRLYLRCPNYTQYALLRNYTERRLMRPEKCPSLPRLANCFLIKYLIAFSFKRLRNRCRRPGASRSPARLLQPDPSRLGSKYYSWRWAVVSSSGKGPDVFFISYWLF